MEKQGKHKAAPNGTLTARQRRAIAALLTEPTVTAAAKTAKVGRRTLQTWLTLPHFRAALSETQGHELGLVAVRLAGLLTKSLDVIGLDMEPGAGADYRLRAAALILRHGSGLLEFADLEQRVSRLEGKVRDDTTEAG
jgi:hypothetical protein